MRLSELGPKLSGTIDAGILRFDCPLHHDHKIRVPLGTSYWRASGEFPDSLSVLPSVSATGSCHWHGHVVNGDVTTVPRT